MELSPEQTTAMQSLAVSTMEEGMGQTVVRAQGLQQELAQRRASLLQESAEVQALQGKEALLAEIVEERNGSLDSNISPITFTSLHRLKKLRHSLKR